MSMIKFPDNFLWGAATASYQIEGAYNLGGRGESIWDRYCRTPGNIEDGTSGDDGCDHYHHYEEDVKLMKELGLKTYRLSIAWPRIFPEGFGKPNPDGIKFYKKLLTLLKKNGIQAAVTLYHWDLPQKLQEIGGWANRKVVDYFVEYANLMFQELGDLVAYWITLNEPYCTSFLGNWVGRHAPGYHDFGTALLVAHHLLLAHGRTVKAFRATGLRAAIGITLNMNYNYPKTDSVEDRTKAELCHAAWNRWFADPIFKGCYPREAVQCYQEKGIMPKFDSKDLAEMMQPIDFLGLNNYFSVQVSKDANNWPLEAKEENFGDDFTEMGWGINPEGMYDLLMRLTEDYGGVKIYITENGAAFRDLMDHNGEVEDNNRIEFLYRYLSDVHRAIEDGANVQAYYLWSLMDNFEWALGYSKRFGIIYVDYETKQRTIKKSGRWYADVIKHNGFEK
ncbi:GH1 family beta-glucosidase [Massiliimalia massiliensis]|uniref:GH1 family beta-glucosidase n=1 Tax=Massiliimalia massiliensis TaxID=1852384 RepID=UPI000987BBE2|nr:GH1 family beta-glucosidase [Massiliimalia massiliensis]